MVSTRSNANAQQPITDLMQKISKAPNEAEFSLVAQKIILLHTKTA
jgi:hypothetical protein